MQADQCLIDDIGSKTLLSATARNAKGRTQDETTRLIEIWQVCGTEDTRHNGPGKVE